jgi:K+-transporting ATPase ATPase C chain
MDMITTSASGLDPHISQASAEIQAKRIAKARGMDDDSAKKVFELVRDHVAERKLANFDEKIVNVLLLNMNLDKISHHDRQ